MQVDFDRLNQYHEAGKLRHSVDPGRNLHVWCYSVQTVYSRDWDDLTMMCRGLVTDSDGNVISRPYRKFFNWGEPYAPGPEITDKPFWAYDKEDGTLIVVGTDSNGDIVVSTKGSFSTWHSEAAREMLGDWKPMPGATGIFEFIHPGNRIVVDYGDFAGLVMLGAVDNKDGTDHYTPQDFAQTTDWVGRVAVPRTFNLRSMLQTVANPESGPNREGFVLVWPNNEGPSDRVKIKFAQYVHLHSVLSRLNNVAVWESLKLGTFDVLLDIAPDEMYEQVRTCADELNRAFIRVKALATFEAAAAEHFPTRREAAEWVKANCEHQQFVFALMDGKNIDAKIWDAVKPTFDQAWSFLK